MSILDRLRPAKPPALALPVALEAMHEAATVFEHGEIDGALLRARFADDCRDADTEPVEPAQFDAAVGELDPDGWRRLSALIALGRRPELAPILRAIIRLRGAAAVLAAVLGVVRGKRLLTLMVLRISALRREELTRAWLAALGIAIAGETAQQSAAALIRLDYERLQAEAERAREAAEDRLAQLKKAQDDDDRARAPRRGKW